ncbi:sensor domain-containing diguanylate cyclase [Variovorax sp. JS1663]|uniref:sensor domain-containing diguanylate cyclase n=1 Tax=Variovorax sp. JS1663 TaxID=1851577 RepID=UPI000B34755E|nr:PAS domain-containing protein [Variovorax sp. JS1663]OUL98092.1 hypothetical protein A8M77_33380 [Variovorax sp. JS1663]
MVVVVLLSTVGVATAALHFVKRNMQAAIANEQFERIVSIASAVDQKFRSRRTLLKTFADSVEAQHLADVQRLQDFVMQHQSLRQAFDSVAFVDMDGNLIASLNGTQQLANINIKDREYFQQTVAAKEGVISQPYRNRLNGMAQIAITEPVLDGAGKVLYVISGAISLKEQNFLGELANIRFGQSGYLFIVNTDGIVIEHPRKSLLLQHMAVEGEHNAALDRAFAGLEGITEATNGAGIHGLYAFKRSSQTNWILGGIYPRSEAFARIDEIERYTWAGALLLTVLVGGLALWVLRSQLRPLERLHEHMQVSRAATDYAPLAGSFAQDEIGDLSRTFDSLMLERQIAHAKLAASERFLRDVTDNLPAVVAYFDRNQVCLFGNRAGLAMRGRTRSDIGTLTMKESLPEAVYRQLEPEVTKVLAGTATRYVGAYDREGTERFFLCHLVPDIRDGGEVVGYYVMTFDITRQKVAERERAAGEARIRTITDNLPALVSHVDESLRYTFVNARVRALHDNAELVGRSMAEVRGEEDFQMIEPYVRRVLAGEAVSFEKTGFRTRGVGQNWFQSHYIPDRDPEGVVRGFYAMTFDVTERKRAEIRSAESEQRLRGLTDNVPALLTELDRDERVVFCNGRYLTWLGIPPSSMMNRPIREVVGDAHYEMRKPLLERAFAGEEVSFEQTAKLLVGERTLQTIYLPQKNEEGEVVGLYILANDVSDLKQKQMQLDSLAREDVLTGLPNRRSFEEHVREAFARSRRSRLPVCLMFLDIDYFKSINDSLGHAAGDAVLKEFGRRLQASVRETDMAARYAGDEFVILLEGVVDAGAAGVVAGKVLSAMRPSFHLPSRTLQVTTSIGVAISEEGENFSTLLACADSALYAAKKGGRNRFMMAPSRSETPPAKEARYGSSFAPLMR